MISADIYQLATLIAALAFLAFVIAFIPTIIQLKRTVKSIQELTIEGKKTVETVNNLVKKTEGQADEFEELLKKIRNLGFKALGLVELILDNIKSPLITILSLLFGVEFGLKYFLKRKKEGGSGNE